MKTVYKRCPMCGKEFGIEMSDEQYEKYTKGTEFIQDIFPEFTPAQREVLITGICEDCWDKLFPLEEDEEEDIIYKIM